MAHSHRPKIDRDEVLRLAHGQWDIVFQKCCPSLHDAMASSKSGPCPVCGGTTRFRLFRHWREEGDGICNQCGARSKIDMVMWSTGWDFRTALEETFNALHGYAVQHGSLPAPRVDLPDPMEDKRRLEKLIQTYDRSVALDHPRARIAQKYLRSRGISGNVRWPEALRFISSIPYYTETKPGVFVKMGEYPALLALVTNSAGKAITLHRIYLTVDGARANVGITKKSMVSPSDRPQSGIMVRLGQPSKILHIAEGVETALAVTLITGQACWATISAVHVANFDPPPGVEAVCIWADKDLSGTGEQCAIALRDRLRQAGLRAVIAMPPYDIEPGEKSFDWLDAVKNFGIEAIRSSSFFVHHLGKVLSAVESQLTQHKNQQSS